MLIINTILENLTSRKDRTWKLTFGSNELSPDQVKELSKALDKFIFLAMKVDEFKSAETEILNELETGLEDNTKSQSQRIKAVLYLLWKQNKEGYEMFDAYYKFKTEKYIEHLKAKIE
jgi:hypothetical protein